MYTVNIYTTLISFVRVARILDYKHYRSFSVDTKARIKTRVRVRERERKKCMISNFLAPTHVFALGTSDLFRALLWIVQLKADLREKTLKMRAQKKTSGNHGREGFSSYVYSYVAKRNPRVRDILVSVQDVKNFLRFGTEIVL